LATIIQNACSYGSKQHFWHVETAKLQSQNSFKQTQRNKNQPGKQKAKKFFPSGGYRHIYLYPNLARLTHSSNIRTGAPKILRQNKQ
jgi:hypothetical protein